jgi:hypothetical protein
MSMGAPPGLAVVAAKARELCGSIRVTECGLLFISRQQDRDRDKPDS